MWLWQSLRRNDDVGVRWGVKDLVEEDLGVLQEQGQKGLVEVGPSEVVVELVTGDRVRGQVCTDGDREG